MRDRARRSRPDAWDYGLHEKRHANISVHALGVVVSLLGAASIKGLTLGFSLVSAGRAKPDWLPIDTGSGMISLGRGQVMMIARTRGYPRLRSGGLPCGYAHGANGSDGDMRSAL